MDERPRPGEPHNVEPEDLALEALLTLRRRWDSALRERGGVSLQALGLEPDPQELYLSAVCTDHGRFHQLWRAPAASDRPGRIDCPGAWQLLCPHECPVDLTYPLARPLD